MPELNRRNILKATIASIPGLYLLGVPSTVRASQHEPPVANEVNVEDENVEYIEQSPDVGFNYPYFLYTPSSLNTDEESPRPILIGPNNSPSSEDDYTTHLERGKSLAVGGRPRQIAERVGIPLLVPVFPRFREEPEPWYVYVQVLDPDTFTIEDSPLSRVDTQLLEMVDDAKSRLEADGHSIASEIHIDGFSGSGTFANRFTILHPERVNAASHGGTTAKTLPKTEIDDDVSTVGDPKWNQMSYPVGTGEEELPYPIGVANLEALTGSSFDKEAWLNTPQYIYIGEEDRPEPGSRGHRSFSNLYDEEAQQIRPSERSYAMPDLIDDIYGVENIDERFEVSRAVYENVGAAATFTVYEGYGHTPRPAMDDLVEFHRSAMQDNQPINQVTISNVEIDPDAVSRSQIHTLTFDVANLSADGRKDEFTISLPSTIIVDDASIIEANNLSPVPADPTPENPIVFTVNPESSVQDPVSMTVELSLSPASERKEEPYIETSGISVQLAPIPRVAVPIRNPTNEAATRKVWMRLYNKEGVILDTASKQVSINPTNKEEAAPEVPFLFDEVSYSASEIDTDKIKVELTQLDSESPF